MTIVLFTMEKKRADSPDRVAFSYANEDGVSYDQKLASVQRVDPDDLDGFCVTEAEVAEHRVAITIDQLIDAGVLSNNIYTAPFCTMERADLFFSYRREKGDFGKTGRLLSVIGRAT